MRAVFSGARAARVGGNRLLSDGASQKITVPDLIRQSPRHRVANILRFLSHFKRDAKWQQF